MGKQSGATSKAARTRAENAERERQENHRLANETRHEHRWIYSIPYQQMHWLETFLAGRAAKHRALENAGEHWETWRREIY